MSAFRFKQFTVYQDKSALKVGTDAVVLGAMMTLPDKTDSRLLDIGTGTGVIALMAAQRLSDTPGYHITAIDIDGQSAGEAAANFAASPWNGSLSAIHSSLQNFEAHNSFDAIFSNPPFYDNSLRNPDCREAAARHTDSLSYNDILAFASRHLTDGTLSLILPAEEELRLRRMAASFGLAPFRIVRIRTTEGKKPRRILAEFRKSGASLHEEEITLQNGPERTEEFKRITKDFYLDQT